MNGPQRGLREIHNVVLLKAKCRLKDTTALRDDPANVAADRCFQKVFRINGGFQSRDHQGALFSPRNSISAFLVDEFLLRRGSTKIVYRQRKEHFFPAKPKLPEVEQMRLAHEELSEIETAHINLKGLRVVG